MLENLLSHGSFIMVNKKLIKELGLHEAIMIGELYSEYNYYKDRDQLDDDYFFSTHENITENTGLSPHQQRQACKHLEDLGIITTVLKGVPAKKYFCVHERQVVKFFNDKGLNFLMASDEKIERQVAKKFNGNNNNNKNNNKNNKIKRDFLAEAKKSEPNNKNSNTKKRKTKQEKAIDDIILKFSNYDFSDKLEDKIIDFYTDQIEKKNYPATNQLTMTLDSLASHSEKESINAIDNSIRNGYKGIFFNSDQSNNTEWRNWESSDRAKKLEEGEGHVF